MKLKSLLALVTLVISAQLPAFEYSRHISPASISGSDYIEAYSGSYAYNVTSAEVYSYVYQEGNYMTGYVNVVTFDGESCNYVNVVTSFTAYIDPYSHTYFDFLPYDSNVLGYFGITGDLSAEALYDLEAQINAELGV